MIPFYKLSGGGNDFISLVEPREDPAPERIRAWCSRGLSLGADGLFVLRRRGAGAEMVHYNADGRPAELCVNGTRCAARLLFELGWATGSATIATGAGPVEAVDEGAGGISLSLPPPAAKPEPCELEVDGAAWRGWRVAVGVPHLVVEWEKALDRAPVATLGPRLRAHPGLGGAGANVDFVRFPAPERLEIRTFERGVEAETLACGSGVLAAAAVGLAAGRSRLPLEALTLGGFRLRVGGRVEDGRPVDWTLAGDARLLAEGGLRPEAGCLPPPPEWQP